MNEVSHLATDKDIVTMLTAIIGAICLVIGGAIGFFTKYFYESTKLKENKKALRQQMITNNIAPMRQAWINDLRSISSKFISEAIFIAAYEKSENKNENKDSEKKYNEIKISIVGTLTYLDLLLPSKTETNNEKEAQRIRKIMKELIFYEKNNMSSKEFNKKVIDIKKELRLLLKKEWEVTKLLKEIE